MKLEFAGLPGSGKTTLSAYVEAELKSSDSAPITVLNRSQAMIQCVRRRDDGRIKNALKSLPVRLWWPIMGTHLSLTEFTMGSSQYFELISFIAHQLNRSKLPDDLAESIWRTFARTFIEKQLLVQYAHSSELIIMDEAFSQRCFTLFGYMDKTIPDKTIRQYAELAPIAKQLIWITTSPQNCIQRLKQRYLNRSSPYELDSKELLDNFQNGHSILQKLCDILEKEKGIRIFRINGDTHIKKSVGEVLAVARRIRLDQNGE